jgi:hypothetical protein
MIFFQLEPQLILRKISVSSFLTAFKNYASGDKGLTNIVNMIDNSFQLSLGFNKLVDSICSVNGSWASNLAGSEVFSFYFDCPTILDELSPWLVYFEDLEVYTTEIKEELALAIKTFDDSFDDSAWKSSTAYKLSASWLLNRIYAIDWENVSGEALLASLGAVGNEGEEIEDIPDKIVNRIDSPNRFRLADEYKIAWIENYGD